MKMRPSTITSQLTAAALLSTVAVSPAQEGAQGGLDGTFTPTISAAHSFLSLVCDPYGDIIATGTFTQIKDQDSSALVNRSRIAKFSRGGVLLNYAPNVDGGVINAAVEPNGSVVYAGLFSTANNTARKLVARYLSNGSLDTTFTLGSPWSGLDTVTSVTRHLNGYLLLGDRGMMRIGLTGSNDTSFQMRYASSGASTASATVQSGGNFLIQGSFLGVAGTHVNTNYIERLDLDGTAAETAFTPNPAFNSTVYCTAVQTDGRILVGGAFGPYNVPAYPLVGLSRTMSNGEKDTAFHTLHVFDNTPYLDGAVRSIAIQADGRILIAGDFTYIRTPVKQSGLWVRAIRRGVARLYPDGSFDPTFDAKIDARANLSVYGVTLQDDGKILIHGNFLSMNGTSRPYAARLINYPATQALTYEDGVISWVRGGSSPEARFVTLERQSIETDFEWVPVDDGYATRAGETSNWTKTVATPIPPGSLIRASANVSASQFNGSTSIVSSTISYMAPVISLARETPHTPIPQRGSLAFPVTGISSPRDISLLVENSGQGSLDAITATLSGANAADFSVVAAPPSSVAIGDSALMEIRFNPTSVGAKTATLTIASSDPLTPSFTITLTGTAITAIEAFRQQFFGTTANTGNAADTNDHDGDGHSNIFEFVAGLDPTERSSIFTCKVERTASDAKVIFGPCLAGRDFEVWYTDNLAADSWTKSTHPISINGTERSLIDPAAPAKRFYRIKITRL